uniref:LsmAD domain-containing protein n=1 Tax=Panagrolaimus superbus TaxID=310955 RepID=A0A914YNQ8_9BILA
MKKSDNPAPRMNANYGEGSSSKKISKSKSRRSGGESSGGKSQSNTSVKASYVGRDVEVRLKNSKIVHGICVNPGLDTVFKLHNAFVAPGAGFEPYVYSKNVHHPELKLPVQDIVDVKATLGNPKKKFATDGEYSTNQNDNDENFKLVQWDCGESSGQPLDHNTSSRGGGGWSVEEMFKKNEDLGVQTTFKDDLTQYTTCEPVGSEEDKIRAARIAREIETNDKSKHLAFLENDDEERDLDKETSVPDGTEEKDQTTPPTTVENQKDNMKKTFQFNPDAPAFVPKPFAPAQSAPVGPVPHHPPLMPQPPPPNNNQPQQFIVAQNVGMQPPGNVVTSTYMPQPIPVMPIYNHQILNNAQTMQAIPPLIQTHPQNIIIRGEYPNAYIQGNPASIQVQHMPVYRMAMPVQPPQQQQQHHQSLSQPQQPITVYQIQPQVQQHYNQIIHQQPQQLIQPQQQHQPRHLNQYTSGGNHYGGNNGGGGCNGGRTRKNNNHHGNNNSNNNWHQNSQSTSQHQPHHVNQPRYQQVVPQTPVYMSQMGHVYVNQNAAITSSSGNNVVHSNVVPINMIPQQYAMPQQVYQRIDTSNMNGMVAVQAQQLPQNTVMVAPNMGMPQHQIHHSNILLSA